MNSFFGSTLLGFIILLLLLGLVTSSIGTTLPTPSNAIVYVNDVEKIYYPEPCATDNEFSKNAYKLRQTTYLETIQNDFVIAPDCHGTLTQKGRSWLSVFLERMGLLAPLESRWDRAGHWKY